MSVVSMKSIRRVVRRALSLSPHVRGPDLCARRPRRRRPRVFVRDDCHESIRHGGLATRPPSRPRRPRPVRPVRTSVIGGYRSAGFVGFTPFANQRVAWNNNNNNNKWWSRDESKKIRTLFISTRGRPIP